MSRKAPFALVLTLALEISSSIAMAETPSTKANDATFEIKAPKPSNMTKSGAPEKESECSKDFKEEGCLRQADAYQRASQAAKYLAYYMQMEKLDPEKLAANKEVFERCFTNPDNCKPGDKETILAASIQHNLGKDIRHMVLQNNTNMNNIRSLRSNANFLFDGKHGNSSGTAKELDDPFRLKVEEVGDSPSYILNSKDAREKEILGPQFLNNYKAFVESYAKTSGEYKYIDSNNAIINVPNKQRWHLETTRIPSKRDGGEIDVYTGKLDTQKFDSDSTTQDQKIVDETMKEVTQTLALRGSKLEENKDIISDQINKTMMNRTNLQDENGKAVEDKNIHRALVADLNKKYDEAIDKKRKEESDQSARNPASAENPKTNTLLDIDFKAEEFSKFLDEIWPPSVAKPAGAPNS